VARPAASRPAKRQHNLPSFRSRRTTPPSAQGRWTLLPAREANASSQTEWSHALALQLLNRYGVLTRESVAAENLPGGFSAVYDVLKALEESGKIRRGYFVAGLGATQFALPAAVDLLRSLRASPQQEKPEMVQMAATDPANPYGSVLRWPAAPASDDGDDQSPRSLTRSVGASVILRNGEMIAYLRRNNPNLQIFLPSEEPDRSNSARDVAHFLARATQAEMQRHDADRRGGLLLSTINGQPAHLHWMSRMLLDAGFHVAPLGFTLRRPQMPPSAEERVAPEVQ
jgi:ATP-dependent helicase Lhr and Lhr-like helicase